MKWRDSDPQEELINAVAEYLEIVESGGDPSEFLVSLGPLAVEVHQIAGVESLLRVDLAVPAPSEIARGRTSLYQSISRDQRSATTGPKLIGLFAAAGLGLALGAGFASGAVPTGPLTTLTDSIPFFGGGSSSNQQEEPPAGDASPEANIVTPQAPARIIEAPILQVPAVIETQPPPATPTPNAGRSIALPPTPSPSNSLPVTNDRGAAEDDDDGDDDDSPTSVPTTPPTQPPSPTEPPSPTQPPSATQPPGPGDDDEDDDDDDDGDDDDDDDDDDD